MVNTVKRKESKRQRFLEQLKLGWSISRAAKISGVSRAQLYRWRDSDPRFAQAWQEAEEIGIDLLEDTARQRAVDGVNKQPIYDKDGKRIGERVEFSDRLLELLLRGKRPRIYGRQQVTNQNINVAMTPPPTLEDLSKRYQELGLQPPVIVSDLEDVKEDASS
jgi:hypothetical protein